MPTFTIRLRKIAKNIEQQIIALNGLKETKLNGLWETKIPGLRDQLALIQKDHGGLFAQIPLVNLFGFIFNAEAAAAELHVLQVELTHALKERDNNPLKIEATRLYGDAGGQTGQVNSDFTRTMQRLATLKEDLKKLQAEMMPLYQRWVDDDKARKLLNEIGGETESSAETSDNTEDFWNQTFSLRHSQRVSHFSETHRRSRPRTQRHEDSVPLLSEDNDPRQSYGSTIGNVNAQSGSIQRSRSVAGAEPVELSEVDSRTSTRPGSQIGHELQSGGTTIQSLDFSAVNFQADSRDNTGLAPHLTNSSVAIEIPSRGAEYQYHSPAWAAHVQHILFWQGKLDSALNIATQEVEKIKQAYLLFLKSAKEVKIAADDRDFLQTNTQLVGQLNQALDNRKNVLNAQRQFVADLQNIGGIDNTVLDRSFLLSILSEDNVNRVSLPLYETRIMTVQIPPLSRFQRTVRFFTNHKITASAISATGALVGSAWEMLGSEENAYNDKLKPAFIQAFSPTLTEQILDGLQPVVYNEIIKLMFVALGFAAFTGLLVYGALKLVERMLDPDLANVNLSSKVEQDSPAMELEDLERADNTYETIFNQTLQEQEISQRLTNLQEAASRLNTVLRRQRGLEVSLRNQTQQNETTANTGSFVAANISMAERSVQTSAMPVAPTPQAQDNPLQSRVTSLEAQVSELKGMLHDLLNVMQQWGDTTSETIADIQLQIVNLLQIAFVTEAEMVDAATSTIAAAPGLDAGTSTSVTPQEEIGTSAISFESNRNSRIEEADAAPPRPEVTPAAATSPQAASSPAIKATEEIVAVLQRTSIRRKETAVLQVVDQMNSNTTNKIPSVDEERRRRGLRLAEHRPGMPSGTNTLMVPSTSDFLPKPRVNRHRLEEAAKETHNTIAEAVEVKFRLFQEAQPEGARPGSGVAGPEGTNRGSVFSNLGNRS